MNKIPMENQSLATATNLLENTRRWRLTYKGLSANLYGKIQERSRNKFGQAVQFNLGQFRTWLESTPFNDLFNKWKANGFIRGERPSIDRIDCLDRYVFRNMQVITAKENRDKGDKEKLILWGKKVYQSTLTGDDIAIYQSIKEASIKTGINKNNISSAVNGKRTQAGGYRWHFYGK